MCKRWEMEGRRAHLPAWRGRGGGTVPNQSIAFSTGCFYFFVSFVPVKAGSGILWYLAIAVLSS